MYGSSFCIVTRRPRALSRRPSEEAVIPLPSETGHATGDEDVLGQRRTSVSESFDAATGEHPTPRPPVPRASGRRGPAAAGLGNLRASHGHRHDHPRLGPHRPGAAARRRPGGSAPGVRGRAPPHLRRRRLRRVGRRDAGRGPPVPRRVLQPGAPLPPAGVGWATCSACGPSTRRGLTTVLAGLGLVACTYLAGRLVSDRAGGLLAGGLVAFTGSILWVTGPAVGRRRRA